MKKIVRLSLLIIISFTLLWNFTPSIFASDPANGACSDGGGTLSICLNCTTGYKMVKYTGTEYCTKPGYHKHGCVSATENDKCCLTFQHNTCRDTDEIYVPE